MSTKNKLKLAAGIAGTGWNFTSWMHKDMPDNANESVDFYIKQAQIAENAKFQTTFLFDVSHVGPGNIPHYLSMFDGATIMSAIAMKTSKIGLSFTAASSYTDPYNIARQTLSLDKISNGRASVNIVTSNPGGMVNFSRGHLGKADQYPMQKEFMEIILGLWDTYEDDAFPRNKATGEFLKPNKMHTIDYRGKYFSVDGPLNLSRSIQGRPVLYTAGGSPAMVEIATTYTDGAFISGFSFQEALHIANSLRTKLIEKNRDPENFVVATAQNPIVGKTDAEAQQKYMELVSLNPYRAMPAPLFFGSAERVANQVQQWYEAGAMNMLIINQDYPTGLADFAELVVPILQARGIFHTEYEADTLRGNLELPKPAFRKI